MQSARIMPFSRIFAGTEPRFTKFSYREKESEYETKSHSHQKRKSRHSAGHLAIKGEKRGNPSSICYDRLVKKFYGAL
jgi:hypothetical protein